MQAHHVCVSYVRTVDTAPCSCSGVQTARRDSRETRASGAMSEQRRLPSVLWQRAKERTCTAAPQTTASSGPMLVLSSLPLKKSRSSCCTLGMREQPPTSTTSSTCKAAGSGALSRPIARSLRPAQTTRASRADLALVHLGVAEALRDGVQAAPEQVAAQLLKPAEWRRPRATIHLAKRWAPAPAPLAGRVECLPSTSLA